MGAIFNYDDDDGPGLFYLPEGFSRSVWAAAAPATGRAAAAVRVGVSIGVGVSATTPWK